MSYTWNLKKCRDPGSNRGPSDLQSDALPTELSRLCEKCCNSFLMYELILHRLIWKVFDVEMFLRQTDELYRRATAMQPMLHARTSFLNNCM